ncbi:MAG TPA: tannase/feruloyl esterase family alpha/beta hydrolase, partial [Bryobacteraceae bacterium]|nr:tannase/feruloyl esterase family alpha/beta hydrolase [Bryobacteraceae bacterium]
VVTTDTGHQGAGFDGSFFQDQQASLDFFYEANGRVAPLAKRLIAAYYGRASQHSYFVGCSTGGREGMIMSQRHPDYFDGIVSGDPAIRTGHSNLALSFIQATFDAAAPKDSSGKPLPLFSAADRKLIVDALLRQCDAQDGLKDGMIFNFQACRFDPAELACSGAKTDACLSPAQAAALKKAFAGPKDFRGDPIYPGVPYDAGIGDTGSFIPGLLSGPRIPVPVPASPDGFDPDRAAAQVRDDFNARLGDATWTNLSSFSGRGGKLIFYHGLSDPWFSPLDTLGYYQRMTRDNGGAAQVENWSRIFLVPGMGHCQGGAATLDQFDMLTAITNWVEQGRAPDSVLATGRDFPGRGRPLCAYPKHAQYEGHGDPNDARNFSCRE